MKKQRARITRGSLLEIAIEILATVRAQFLAVDRYCSPIIIILVHGKKWGPVTLATAEGEGKRRRCNLGSVTKKVFLWALSPENEKTLLCFISGEKEKKR